jgi:hypothetical protein
MSVYRPSPSLYRHPSQGTLRLCEVLPGQGKLSSLSFWSLWPHTIRKAWWVRMQTQVDFVFVFLPNNKLRELQTFFLNIRTLQSCEVRIGTRIACEGSLLWEVQRTGHASLSGKTKQHLRNTPVMYDGIAKWFIFIFVFACMYACMNACMHAVLTETRRRHHISWIGVTHVSFHVVTVNGILVPWKSSRYSWLMSHLSSSN